MKNDLTQEYLKSILRYDPLTGLWTWLVNRGKKIKVGDSAGHKKPNGYIYIGIDGKLYLAHRLAWLYMKGEWPILLIDHKNRIKHDNEWFNLREATNSQNMRNTDLKINNKTGLRGVRLHQGKYIVNIRIDDKNLYVGIYDTLDEASLAFNNANNKYNFPTFELASSIIQGVMLG